MIRCLSVRIAYARIRNRERDGAIWRAIRIMMARAPARSHLIDTAAAPMPRSVNFSAFDSRFLSTCCSRLASVCMTSFTSELSQLDAEVEILALRHMPERLLAVILQFHEPHAADFHVHLAGLDLAEIQNVADQRQQVGPGCVDGLREFDLLRSQILVGVLRKHPRQNQQIIQRRAKLVTHVGQEFALVLRSQRQLFGLFFQRLLGLLHFLVLGFDFCFLLSQ